MQNRRPLDKRRSRVVLEAGYDRPMVKVCLVAGCLVIILAMCAPLTHAETGKDVVPDLLKPPAGQIQVLSARGTGVQIYACAAAADDAARFAWTLKAPEAILRDASGKIIGKHYAGPTWEAGDGSKVVGEVAAKLDAPDAGSIPWLLVRAKSTTGAGNSPGMFGAVVSIQRINTRGGKAPAGGCDASQAGREFRAPYSAVYVYFAATPSPSPAGAT